MTSTAGSVELSPELIGTRTTYRVLSQTGQGAMADVFRAVAVDVGVEVAIKRSREDTPHARTRFQREIDALYRITHPAVVPIVDHGADARGLWLAMRWVDGVSLSQALAAGALSEDDVLVLAHRLAGALAAIHAEGLIHRDVKPANILLPGGRVHDAVLVDFGLALRSDDPRATQTGVLVGTPMYMSPEQARGETSLAPATDIFSLGATLYECAAGRPPFLGSNALAVLAKVLTLRAEPLGRLAPWTLLGFDRLIECMLHREPEHRPRDGAALLRALCEPRPLRAARDEHLSEVELRPVTVLVARASAAPPSHDATITLGEEGASLAEWTRVVERFGGVAEAAVRGSLFVSFGSQSSPRDQANLAGRAALALREVAPELHISLVTGHALVAPSGASELTASLADRALQALEKGASGTISADDATVGLFDNGFVTTHEGPGALVLGRIAEPGVRRLVAGRTVPILGRELEVRTLELTVLQAEAEGHPIAVWVLGEPGGGKTTLRALVAARLGEVASVRVVRCRADQVQRDAPYATLVAMLEERFALSHLPTRAERIEALRPKLHDAGIGVRLAEPLSAAFDIVEAASARDPATLQRELIAAVRTWFEEETRQGGVLALLLDDVQWVDAATWAVLEEVLSSASSPVALVGFGRPEFADGSKRFARLSPRTLPLAKLSARVSERILRAVLPSSSSDSEIDAFVRIADGSPLFLEELARASTSGAQQRARLGESLVTMLQVRCAELAPPLRQTLKVASVIGMQFTRDMLCRTLSTDVADHLDQSLATLVACELLDVGPSPGTWGFRHALVLEANYESLAPNDAQALHGRVYDALKEIGAPAAELALHAQRAALPDRAATELTIVAESKLAASDLQGAHDAILQALALEPSGELRGEVLLLGVITAFFLGDLAVAYPWAIEGLPLASTRSLRWVRAVGYASAVVAHLHPPVRPAVLEAAMFTLVEREPEPEVLQALAESLALIAQTSSLLYLQDLALLERVSARLVELLALAEARPSATGWISLGLAWHVQYVGAVRVDGKESNALSWYERGARAFEDAGDTRNLVPVVALAARVCASLGRWQDVRERSENALRIAESIGGFAVVFARLHRAAALARMARSAPDELRPDEARAVAGELSELLALLDRSAYFRSECHTGLALVALAEGHAHIALEHARRAIEATGPCPLAIDAYAVALELGDGTAVAGASQVVQLVRGEGPVWDSVREQLRAHS
jgi:tRNA A-37 threonylcarbamoyl transferase component Bud32